MFDQDALHQRGKALEDEFFRRVDQKLMEDLRKSREREEARKELASASGFKDQHLLDSLLDAGFETSTLAALTLVPAVFVAWADGSVTIEERQAVMEAALHRGVAQQPTAMKLLEAWLDKHPPRTLWKVWKEYARAIHASVPAATANALSQEIMEQAIKVAESSGGTLGFGKVSQAEKEILDEIRATFASPE